MEHPAIQTDDSSSVCAGRTLARLGMTCNQVSRCGVAFCRAGGDAQAGHSVVRLIARRRYATGSANRSAAQSGALRCPQGVPMGPSTRVRVPATWQRPSEDVVRR